MHRRRPLADTHASSRRDAHPNEAQMTVVHQYRAASHVHYA
ncbi:hypothetical protein [Paraburkholderia bryophila]|nr:hypothetical protein [Paraburkholderia bryophila]